MCQWQWGCRLAVTKQTTCASISRLSVLKICSLGPYQSMRHRRRNGPSRIPSEMTPIPPVKEIEMLSNVHQLAHDNRNFKYLAGPTFLLAREPMTPNERHSSISVSLLHLLSFSSRSACNISCYQVNTTNSINEAATK